MDAFVFHNGKMRKARGFSFAELVSAGFSSCENLKSLHIRLDPYRKTKYDENIKILKSLKK